MRKHSTIFNHFMPTSFCQSVLGSFFRHAAESLPLHCCLLLLVKSQVSACFYNPFLCSQSLLIRKPRKSTLAVFNIFTYGDKNRANVDTSRFDNADYAGVCLLLFASCCQSWHRGPKESVAKLSRLALPEFAWLMFLCLVASLIQRKKWRTREWTHVHNTYAYANISTCV